MSTDNTNRSQLEKKGHPVRGILWGIPFGLGLAVVLIVTTIISLELVQIIVVVILGTAAGLLWSLFGPARSPKGPPPAVSPPDVEQPRAPLEDVDTGPVIDEAEIAPDSEVPGDGDE